MAGGRERKIEYGIVCAARGKRLTTQHAPFFVKTKKKKEKLRERESEHVRVRDSGFREGRDW